MPQPIDTLLHQALAAHRSGNTAAAALLYRQALDIDPRHPDALHLLGVLTSQSGNPAEGTALITRAIEADPKPMYRANLVHSLLHARQLDDARSALNHLPASAHEALWQTLAEAFYQAGRIDDALAIASDISRQNPKSVAALSNLGVCLMAVNNYVEAVDVYTRAIALAPNVAAFHSNLCQALTRLGRFTDAVQAGRRAVGFDPNLAIAHLNLGVAQRDRADLPGAIASFNRAIQLDPNLADAHLNLAFALLESGDYAAGWLENEWRWKTSSMPPLPSGVLSKPAWTGDNLAGRTLLVLAEQGFGDILQFARYLPLLANRGGRAILIAPPELRSLLSFIPGPSQVLLDTDAIPPFDTYAPLISLPRLLQTADQIPQPPYIAADPNLAAMWAQKLDAHAAHPRIGLVWAGSSAQQDAERKRVPFQLLADAIKESSATFFSLQTGPASDDLAAHSASPRIIDLSPDLTDFSQTAAAIHNLDLIITTDTAVAHLAGAMGKPTWLLLSAAADWRWPRNRNSPWYPQTRIFRQSTLNDWTPVIADLRAVLAQYQSK